MGSWIHDGFLDSWNPCVKDLRILDLLESIIGFSKSFVQWAGIEVKNKKLMPISNMSGGALAATVLVVGCVGHLGNVCIMFSIFWGKEEFRDYSETYWLPQF